jgi:hypothetical protein
MKARYLLQTLSAVFLISLTALVLVPDQCWADIWQVPLEVENGAAERDTVIFGIHPDGTPGIDPDLGEVGLPPWPPGSLYEVRFMVEGCEGLKIDIRDTTHTRRLHTLKWQAGSGGYPVTIRWDRYSLPFASMCISDAYGGIFIPPVNMYEADSVRVPPEWNFIKEMTLDVTPGVSPGALPVLDDIPDAEIFQGQQFPEYELDDYVFDPDTPDSLLAWFVIDNESPLVFEIDTERVLRVAAPAGWIGMEEVTFVVRDPEFHTDETYVTFTVLSAGLLAWSMPITVENGAAELRTCYFGMHPGASDGIDPELGEVSLPPWPPSEAFDARFQLPDVVTWSIQDIRPSSPDPITYYLAWQAGSGGYPVTVSWDPGSLPLGTFLLSDDKGGVFVDSLDMTDTSEVVFPPDQSIVTGVVINAVVVMDTVPPVGPSNLTVTAWVNGAWASLEWSACIEDHFAYYEVLYDTVYFDTLADYVWDWTEDAALTSIGTTTTTVTLPVSADYFGFRIRAWDLFGNSSPLSNLASVGLAGAGDNVPGNEEMHLTLDVRPNPAMAGGTVSFVFPEATEGAIAVYSVAGRCVADLPVEPGGPSRDRMTWDACETDGRHLSPGVYFCRLKAGEATITRKFIILR